MAALLVLDGTVITVDRDRRVITDGGVAVEDGEIVAVGPASDLRRRFPQPERVVDARGAAILPGFVNGHTHGCMLYGRTLGYDRDFVSWFGDTQLPMMTAMTPEDYALAETLTMVENLLEGNTTVLENGFFPESLRRDGRAVVVEAAERTGVRTVVADAYLTGNTAPELVEDPDAALGRQVELLEQLHGRGRFRVALSPLLPWATSVEELAEISRLARDRGAMVHAHCAETPVYNERCQERHGVRSNVGLHAAAGALGPWVQLVGCSELDSTDVELIAETGTRVISVPTSDLFQSHRPLVLTELLERGVPVSFASNGCAGNGGQSMFAAMKDGAGLAKALSRDPAALTKDMALEMATIRAAENLGIADLVGSLEVGKRGDIIVVDLQGAHCAPALNPVAAVTYSCRGSDVRHVFVDGEPVVAAGRCTRLDVGDLAETVQRRAGELAAADPRLRRLASDDGVRVPG